MTRHPENSARLPRAYWSIAAWSAAALLLLVPLVAMQFTDEVNWNASDFIFAAGLMLAVGVPLELAVRMTRSAAYRAGAGLALVAAFLIVWLGGAVGIIGSENHPANLLYLGVLAVAIGGALAARFRPGGTARAMLVDALALLAIAVVAVVAGWGSKEASWPWKEIILHGFFAALFIGSAMLFRAADREQLPARTTPELS